jgi:formylglycine-generating enzyme required for sulfatase activity
MILVPGGRFRMGSDDFYPEERPRRDAQVKSFWIDAYPVTNAQFRRFVEETGYVTFTERPMDPRAYPGAPADLLQPGSFVFHPPAGETAAVDHSTNPAWWSFVFGACWQRPLGPHSDLDGLADHPVVHVVAEDAEAYARWAGKSLPTEAEWEYAARGGQADDAPYAWGREFEPGGQRMAKVWQGVFPGRNTAPKGLERTAPVGSYPPNGFGLYDMIGNVWEWTADRFAIPGVASQDSCCGKGETKAPAEAERHVLKGGSHLCAPNYCRRYRPAARWPQPVDTATSHIGFRCISRETP